MTKLTIAKAFIATFLLTILCGCTSNLSMTPHKTVRLSESAKTYLKAASTAQGEQKQNYQLLAIQQLLNTNDTNSAQQLLSQLNQKTLTDTAKIQTQILKAQLTLKENRPDAALRILHSIHNIRSYPKDIQANYFLTSSEAFLRHHNLAYSTLARITLSTLIEDPAVKLQNQTIIWHNLQRLSNHSLTQLLKRSDANLLRGWLTLALLSKEQNLSPQTEIEKIAIWEQKYPNHEANTLLPDNDTLNTLLQIHPPTQIALLVPLQGKFGQMGQAIRNGFMTEFYEQLKILPQSPKIKIYDTAQSADITTLYQKAINDGADFVVGPLTKTNTENLAQSGNITVPTLILNYLPKDEDYPSNLIQFGLSPNQSAKQTAELARQYGSNQILTISPDNKWGNKVVEAFVTKWRSLNGQLADSFSFSTAKKTDLAHNIAAMLHVDQSQHRGRQLETLFGKRLKTIVRRRQDIDGIFLLATPNQARQIRPLLNFYYANNVPVFSIANIYQGLLDPRKDRDLDGIYFTDMPWLLKNTAQIQHLKAAIKASWPNNYKTNNRLYALGIDAYTISMMLQHLRILPNFPIYGVTGHLFLMNGQYIYQQLLWAQFRNGRAHALT